MQKLRHQLEICPSRDPLASRLTFVDHALALTSTLNRAHQRASQSEETKMRKLLAVALSILVISSMGFASRNGSTVTSPQDSTSTKKRGPVFRATKEQINQAQSVLKSRGFYGGQQTGKLDDATRDGLRKYQSAENIKVTGTLNKVTLEKMGIELTDKQRAM
jgi:hypothetical protein